MSMVPQIDYTLELANLIPVKMRSLPLAEGLNTRAFVPESFFNS